MHSVWPQSFLLFTSKCNVTLKVYIYLTFDKAELKLIQDVYTGGGKDAN